MSKPGSAGNVLAAVASLFLPGLGQLLQGQMGKAILYFGVILVVYPLTIVLTAVLIGMCGWPVIAILHIVAAYDAAIFEQSNADGSPAPATSVYLGCISVIFGATVLGGVIAGSVYIMRGEGVGVTTNTSGTVIGENDWAARIQDLQDKFDQVENRIDKEIPEARRKLKLQLVEVKEQLEEATAGNKTLLEREMNEIATELVNRDDEEKRLADLKVRLQQAIRRLERAKDSDGLGEDTETMMKELDEAWIKDATGGSGSPDALDQLRIEEKLNDLN